MITRLSNAALALVLAGLSLAQEPRDPSQGYVPPRSFGPVDAKVHAGMQGIWKIEKAEWDEIGTFSGQDLEGCMLIDEGHLAYEVHASVYDDLDEEYLIFESGVSRYQFSPVGELETIAMVGADNLTSFLELEHRQARRDHPLPRAARRRRAAARPPRRALQLAPRALPQAALPRPDLRAGRSGQEGVS